VVIPTAVDDGWIVANAWQQNPFEGTNVFFPGGAGTSLWGHWIGLLQHHWFKLGDSTLVMRAPIVLLWLGVWFGLRVMVDRMNQTDRMARWVLAAGFVVGVGAWGMSFRLEPFVAALLLISMALTAGFWSGRTRLALFGLPLVVALAINAHVVGIVVLAPILVAWRPIRAWVLSNRSAGAAAATALLATGALAVLLYSWDSNLATQLDGFRSVRSVSSHGGFVFDELKRYAALGGSATEQGDSLLRRLSVVTMVGSAALFLLRRYGGHRSESSPDDHPIWTLLVSLALLALLPSKWTWHFGALIAVSPLALVAALRRPASGLVEPPAKLSPWATAMALLATSGAVAWAFSSTDPWALFDLRTQRWWPGAENLLPVSLASARVWLAGWAVTWVILRRWRAGRHRGQASSLIAVSVSLLAVGLTASTFALDVVRTDGWTFGGSALETAMGRSECGLGDVVRVPRAGSLRRLESADGGGFLADEAARAAGFDLDAPFPVGGFPPRSGFDDVPLAGIETYGSWGGVANPGSNLGAVASPWKAVAGDIIVVFVMGGFEGFADNAVALQWSGPGLDPAHEVTRVDESAAFGDWHLVGFDPPGGADAVRVLVRDNAAGDGLRGWVAASEPLSLGTATLAEVGLTTQPTFVSAALVPHLPCLGHVLGDEPRISPPEVLVREVSADGSQAWPVADVAAPYLVATLTDRYYGILISIPPAEKGDRIEVVVSQRYLTGRAALSTAEFERVSG
jgi:hypothetical protein